MLLGLEWAGERGGGVVVVCLNRLCLLGGVVGWLVGEMVVEGLWRCCERGGGREAGCRNGGVLIESDRKCDGDEGGLPPSFPPSLSPYGM